ncbi:putative aminopeptidase [Frateuria aurantia DSM 6220]|uniref:Putative aminopeptidase n=1 Tax=Frateuria aurantia (strain ATCC 33424 / DSM 6220 / KCTC 2777 / LMG 1558 / NBRC 3245 / NCIMB 13370) TaxID=767434 RepID=H8L3Y5_FRAAD|nr:putative aminopeptidase [Frateuria aurantia DSM 6220]
MCLLLSLGGCHSVAFYGQALHGQSALWWHRQSIRKLVADPATPPALVARLKVAQQARQFASDHLDLPRNRSYTYFVPLRRPYVVWNVFATPAWSVDPVRHCFPVAGCVAYRGWFSEGGARAEARRLKAAGNDVYIGGVPAYSTLGWFADPVLSSMLAWSDDDLAGTIFHELAHQQIYVQGDTAFNESYASFVERQGIREWRHAQGLAPPDPEAGRIEDDFTRQVLQLRQELRALYARTMSASARGTAKQAAFARFRERYRTWSQAHGVRAKAYQAWVEGPLNNASLLPFGLYDGWEPGFAHLFASVHQSWPAFFAAVRQWARLPAPERDARLQQWTGVVTEIRAASVLKSDTRASAG